MALTLAQNHLGVVFVKGVEVDFTVANVTSRIGPLTFSISPALPDGLSLNVIAGLFDSRRVAITGTPTVDVSMADYVITVSDLS